jgi:hypothetical protein
MYFRDSPVASHAGLSIGARTSAGATALPTELDIVESVDPGADVAAPWTPFAGVNKLLAIIVGIAATGTAVSEIAHWPPWVFLGCAPLAVMAWQTKGSSSLRRTALAGLMATAVIGAGTAAYLALHGTETSRRIASAVHVRAALSPWLVRHVGYAISELAADAQGDLWTVAAGAISTELDAWSLEQLGAPRRFAGDVHHVIACAGQVLVTYGDGLIAEIGGAETTGVKRLKYGHPIDAGALDGTMVCGDHSVFVAMPLEARVVRIAVPRLRVLAGISVGRFVSSLGFVGGTLFAVDATQAAVISVDLRTNLAWRWTVTTAAPGQIVGLRGGGAVLSHNRSRCLGYVRSGARRETGESWSPNGAVRALAIGRHHGVLVDDRSHVYRFDARTGEQDAQPVKLPLATRVTGATVTRNDTVVLAVPESHALVDIPPRAWKPSLTQSSPASGCLSPEE